MVIDPWGTKILDLKEEIGYGVCEIDLNKTYEVRKGMSCLEHARHDLY